MRPTSRRLPELLAGMADAVPACDVSGLALDSRALRAGDLFLAARGLTHHGLDFLAAAEAAGAAAVAWEPPHAPVTSRLPLVEVPSLGRHLSRIADRWFEAPSAALAVVGVTGTDGKTSVAHFVAEALSEAGRPAGILGTLGYGLRGHTVTASHTTPDALAVQRWLAAFRDAGARYAAMEVSSHALAQHRVEAVRFAVAVLTNLTRDHLDFHGSTDAYAAAKARLFTELAPAQAVLNLDDGFGAALAERLGDTRPVIGYGFGARPAVGLAGWVRGEGLRLDGGGLTLTVHSHRGSGELRSALFGRFNAANLLAALATLLALDLPFDEALARVGRVSTVAGRMERFGGGARPLAVVDYAHTPHALESVLQALREHAAGRLTCVFGCGGDRDAGKRPQMGAIAERLADQVIVTHDNPRREDPAAIVADILAGLRDPARASVIGDRRRAIQAALAAAAAGDIVLIAGKGHEDYQLIGDERLDFSDRAEVAAWFEGAA